MDGSSSEISRENCWRPERKFLKNLQLRDTGCTKKTRPQVTHWGVRSEPTDAKQETSDRLQ